MKFAQEWRQVPGFAGQYQVSFLGEVRRVYKSGKTRMMTPYKRQKPKGRSSAFYVKLSDGKWHGKDVAVAHLVAAVWLGGVPEGMVTYHKNGDTKDNRVSNIGFIKRQELGKLTGALSGCMPVAKINKSGEVVALYPSARQAAKKNHMRDQTILDRCHKRVKKEFALDGFSYRFM